MPFSDVFKTKNVKIKNVKNVKSMPFINKNVKTLFLHLWSNIVALFLATLYMKIFISSEWYIHPVAKQAEKIN